ncbi:MAG: carboxypeptidase-like regulatory domain-containing protein, partial [Duncaniella sp.]|nr:carboxypeptidase-like regulatory domain-containing protein [Duncaniella sp.]
MIRRIITLLMAYTIGITCISAQNQKVTDANIGGHVIDTENGEHMPGCLIKILGTSLATVTDASGHYIFRDLKPGDYTLEVSCAGYVTTKLDTSVKPHQTVELNFNVAPAAFMLDQVVVTSSKSETRRRESPSLVNV